MSAGFQVELSLPLRWQASALDICQSKQITNACVYTILDGYSDVVHAVDAATEATPLDRLEAKVNLLLALTTRLLQEQDQGPPANKLHVTLTASHIRWQTDTPAVVGQHLTVQLYLDPRLPQPLTLCGEVQADNTAHICVELAHADEQEEAAWQRWLFRQHRHQIAKLRHPHRN